MNASQDSPCFISIIACNMLAQTAADVKGNHFNVPVALCADRGAIRRRLKLACERMAAKKELQELVEFLNSPRQEV